MADLPETLVVKVFQQPHIRERMLKLISCEDFMRFTACSKVVRESFGEIMHELLHRCFEQKQEVWSHLITEARYLVYRRHTESLHVRKTELEDYVICSAFPSVGHHLGITYVCNPMDVDIIVWYLDGKKFRWTMV